MTQQDWKIKYGFDDTLTPNEAKARRARAFGVVFDEIEKDWIRLYGKKIPQQRTQ